MIKAALFRDWLDPFSDKTYQRFGWVVMGYLLVIIGNLLWFMAGEPWYDLVFRWRLRVMFLLHLSSYASIIVLSFFWDKSARFVGWLIILWSGMGVMILGMFVSPYAWLMITCIGIGLVFHIIYLLMQCWVGSGPLEKWLDRQAGMQAVSLIAWIVALFAEGLWQYLGFLCSIPPLILLYYLLQQVRRLLSERQLEAELFQPGEAANSGVREELY